MAIYGNTGHFSTFRLPISPIIRNICLQCKDKVSDPLVSQIHPFLGMPTPPQNIQSPPRSPRPLPKISGSFQKHLSSPRNSYLSPKYPSSPRSPRPLPKVSGPFRKHLSSLGNSRFLSKIPIPSQKHHLPVKISFTSRKYLSFPGRLSPRNPRLFAEISSSPHPIKLPWECPGTALSSAGQRFSQYKF